MREKEQGGMNLLGRGAFFNGELKVTGSIRIDGEFDGKMEVSESVIIGKTGKVKGTVISKDAVIGGNMEGNVDASERIELQAGSHLAGDIRCRGLVVEDGVFFDGNCKMSGDKRPAAVKPKSVAQTGVAQQ
jgi:cytoskeletal protein CcmA (bactofilin family)